MVDYKRFNDHAEIFLRRMHETFPHEKKIVSYQAKFDMVSSMDGKKPVEMFMDSMFPYGEQILSRDENFFKQDYFVNKAESISQKMGLVNYYDSMNQETRDTIWEYIQGLFIMGMGIQGRISELQELIKKTGFSAN